MLGLDNPIHLLFLLVLLLVVFGAKRMPEMGRSLGSGMRGFKQSLSDEPVRPAALEQSSSRIPRESSTVATAAGEAVSPRS